MMWWSQKPYVSVAERCRNAQQEIAKLAKAGRKLLPVQLEGKKIASTFWGNAWCENLQAYSDFASRLPRGRSYVRNGLVCDLQIEPGRISAMVFGSAMYRIEIKIKRLPAPTWSAIRRECVGQIGSVIELLQGKFSQSVMQIMTRLDGGLFPTPAEIELDCSCPDWASMCKHVAAVLYGIGARLDTQPELLFVLRQVDHLELIEQAGDVKSLAKQKHGTKTIATEALSEVFGIDMVPRSASAPEVSASNNRKAAKSSEDPKSPRSKKSRQTGRAVKSPADARRGRANRRTTGKKKSN